MPKLKLLATAALLAVICLACNKDEVISVAGKPEITLDSETGVYTVKVGAELIISPTYKNAEKAIYIWSIDGTEVLHSPVFVYSWSEAGTYYVSISVTNPAGTATEEMRVEVIENQAPVISLPLPGESVTIALHNTFTIRAEVAGSDVEGFSKNLTVDG